MEMRKFEATQLEVDLDNLPPIVEVECGSALISSRPVCARHFKTMLWQDRNASRRFYIQWQPLWRASIREVNAECFFCESDRLLGPAT